MDLLQQCALGFEELCAYQYHVVLGRKGTMVEFTLTFDQADFHHLCGLHKLKDHTRFLTGIRTDIFKEIIQGKLTLEQAKKSVYYSEMESRLKPLVHLERFLDQNELIFRYNSKVHVFSMIRADYLLEHEIGGIPIYLFLAQREGTHTQVCRTFFPKADKDYTKGQPRYTLLKKEKIHRLTGEVMIQYDRLTSRTTSNNRN